ncbi:MAG: ubiquinone/menaquinone biosynthesis methyltransferase [Isosphaeraceae bacterium]|nr:ubiquinone/menaquinone biosynthesis methyltransferase [Isosphaeraceae bacterium]
MATDTSPAPPSQTVTPVDKSDQRVRSMFASIAGKYDFLNHLLSLNVDRRWRRFTTRTVPPQDGIPVLDCCTGTADLALAYYRAGRGKTPVVGTDFCREMLRVGTGKVAKAGASQAVTLVEGDTQRLPLPDDTFGVVTVAFGLRNVKDTTRGLDEMIRVARPGGKVAILEFSRPRGRVLGALYLAFFRHVLPRVGQAIAPNDANAYHYLPTSVLQFPDGAAMLALLKARGLTRLEMHPLTCGIATLYVGVKPAAGSPR